MEKEERKKEMNEMINGGNHLKQDESMEDWRWRRRWKRRWRWRE